MAKSIHERVRATLAKAALAEKRAEAARQAKADAPMYRRMAAAERREEREEGIRDGSIMPRNAREEAMQCDALEEIYGDEIFIENAPNVEAADNCRAILAQLTVNGKVDHKAFHAEMNARAASTGQKLTPDQYELLGRIVAAYEAELS